MALKRIEVDINGVVADVTEDDGSDASTSDVAFVYDEAQIASGDKNSAIEHFNLILDHIQEFPETTAMAAGHTRWYLEQGKTMHDVVFETAASFAVLDPSTDGHFAVELLPAGTYIGHTDTGLITETSQVLIQYLIENGFPL